MNLRYALVASGLLAITGLTGDVDASPYKMAGCGLGSVVIGSDGFIQIFAATTNGTSGTQTFGITTGTSNCVRSGVVLADKEQEAFFEANLSELQSDIAAGGGEHLNALAELFSCSEDVQQTFNEVAQQSYENVFPTKDTSPVHALYMLKISLSRNDAVAARCVL